MVGVVAHKDTKCLFLVGCGITVKSSFELAPGIVIEPTVPSIDIQQAADGSSRLADYLAVVTGRELATFSIRVERDGPGLDLAAKGWNALWDFHLLSLAAQAPVCSLYSVAPSPSPRFSSASRSGIVQFSGDAVAITPERLAWAKSHKDAFESLINVPQFNSAMRCYGNSHHLYDADLRIMLLWAGIEGLLSVDAELTRRVALYAALMIEGSHDEKVQWFAHVKKAYAIRSKAVHGATASRKVLDDGCEQAGRIVTRLLARCVEIGRVPTPTELDALALKSTVS